MSTITNIDLSLPNDGDGTKLRTGGGFINANFANLNADKLERGGYAGTAQDIVNLIGAGVSPVENDYADIAAMLADQANQTEDFLQFVADATDDPNFDPVGDEIYAFYRYLGTTNSSLIDYVLLSPSEAAEVIVTPNYRQFEVKNVNDNIDDTTATGSVLVKTEDNEIIAILFDPSFSKYLQGFKTLLDDEGKEFYIKSYNKTSAGKKLYVAKVSSIEYADVGETCYLVEVGANLTGGILTATDIIEVFFDLDFTGGVTIPTEEEISGTRQTASVSGSTPLNWSAYKVFELTLTGAATLTDSNLPTGTDTKVIELIVTGSYALTLPAYWTANPNNDTYDGAKDNHILVSCINGTGSSEKVIYTLQNLT